MVQVNNEAPKQKPRPDKLANYKPDVKVDSPPFDYTTPRQFTDKPWAILCIIGFITFFALGGALKSNAKAQAPWIHGQMSNADKFAAWGKVGVNLADDYKNCMLENFQIDVTSGTSRGRQLFIEGLASLGPGAHRHLSEADQLAYEHHRKLAEVVDNDWTMWDLFANKIEVPVTMIMSCAAVGVAWLVLLRFLATPIVYATLGVQIAFLVYIGSLAADGGSGDAAAFFYVAAALAIVWCLLNPGKIRMAATLMSESAGALGKNPSLFLSCLLFYAPYLIYVYLYIHFLSQVPLNWSMQPDTYYDDHKQVMVKACYVRTAPWAIRAKDFLVFHFFFSGNLMEQLRLHLVSGVVGTWYFSNTENKPTLVTAYWIKNGLTKSLGTLSIGALIGALCDYIRYKASKTCWCCDPEAWVAKFILCFASAFVTAMTRMNTVIHTFTGKSFCASAEQTLAVLKRNLVGAIATEFISQMVMYLGCFVFSTGLAISAWAWYEKDYAGINVLTGSSGDSWEIWLWMFIILLGCLKPTLTVLIVGCWVADSAKGCIGGCEKGLPVVIPLAACFIGSLCHMVFDYIAGIVRDTTSCLLMATAIDNDNGAASHDGVELTATLQKLPCMYAIDNPASGGGGAEEDSTALKRRGSKHVV